MSQENYKPIDIKNRIETLRRIYWPSGAQIYFVSAAAIQKYCVDKSLTVPENNMGFLSTDNKLLFNSDKLSVVYPDAPFFIYTPSVTILCGPTFIHALEYGYYRLVCNFAGKIDDLTEQDVLQHAQDIKKWFINPRVVYPNQPSQKPLCQDVDKTLELMREMGRGTPIVPLIDKLPKNKSFFDKLFGK